MEVPSETGLAKAKRLLQEVSNYVADRPDIYPMDEGCIAVDFRNREGRAGVLFVIQKEATGCSVRPSPLDNNPYHADILIPVPLDSEERRYAVIEYARDLAYRATFLPWGEWTDKLT